MKVFVLFAVVLFCGASSAPADRKEAWGYVDVRKDAHMFWWLYYTDQTTNYASYPLVIWLQGGPGASSTGYGNFLEIGPLDEHLRPRNSTWLSKANLLFIDNPVGTGFSYVTNKSALATTNKQIADDLVTCLTSILDTVPEFQKSPLYIFSESYGGKMTVDFALALSKAIKSKTINVNFKGIALGDSWISPIDSVYTWGPYLYATSLLDKVGLQSIKAHAYEVKQALAAGQFKKATDGFSQIQELIGNFTNGVDFYNILKNEGPSPNKSVNTLPKNHRLYKLFRRQVDRLYGDVLSDLMNGKIRQKLNDIPKNVTWGGQSSDVFEALSEDFMKPVVSSVSELLSNETYIDVNVYTGQLDLIVDTLGTLAWIEKLNWPGNKGFMTAPKKPLTFPNDRTGGFVKTFKQFSFFWILKAGHMVPSDAPESALKMLDMILKKNK
ncbi:retinoid-inducible serine carboxypeptidase isoform X2 [Parasteatoda tepidariorum]|uniref:retinoid-inducible serine carboxypeptidase isoform X2 n=1 Tax=Parasteatoda tepidariorum TaxID=114398 RepID=UPI00077F8916|nr:retinoid-inducible serine carboxypeptidase isoform X2 [Parasteatoda tepidariorum]